MKPAKTTTFIKDLEMQIDRLIGYAPQGNNWKREYTIRQALLDTTLCDETTPTEIVEKINRIQDAIYNMQDKKTHKQGYLKYSKQDYLVTKDTVTEEPINKQQVKAPHRNHILSIKHHDGSIEYSNCIDNTENILAAFLREVKAA